MPATRRVWVTGGLAVAGMLGVLGAWRLVATRRVELPLVYWFRDGSPDVFSAPEGARVPDVHVDHSERPWTPVSYLMRCETPRRSPIAPLLEAVGLASPPPPHWFGKAICVVNSLPGGWRSATVTAGRWPNGFVPDPDLAGTWQVPERAAWDMRPWELMADGRHTLPTGEEPLPGSRCRRRWGRLEDTVIFAFQSPRDDVWHLVGSGTVSPQGDELLMTESGVATRWVR